MAVVWLLGAALKKIMLRVFEPAIDEMRFDIFKLELLLKKISNDICIHAILTGVDIGRNESAFRKCVDADVALSDDDEPAPAARILDMVIRCGDDHWFRKRAHLERVTQFGKNRENDFFTAETFRITAVTVDSDVFAEVG